MAERDDGLLSAFVLDGRGGGRPLDWDGIEAWRPGDGLLWVHLDRTGARAREWVASHPDIEPAAAETLVNAEGNRPRVNRIGQALVVMLRGVNQNSGADPADMPTMHMWIGEKIIVSMRRRRMMAGTQLRQAIEAGEGPGTPGEFLVEMSERLLDPMTDLFGNLEDEVDALHAQVMTGESATLRRDLREVRHAATLLRRHIAPQRDALTRLHAEPVEWLRDLDRAYLREVADRTTRYVEDIDSARERAAIAQEELNTRIADQMNRTMYLLTIVSALLLPPSLLTGLFGINVGGMPGVENATAFTIVAVSIPVLAVVEFIILKRMRWF